LTQGDYHVVALGTEDPLGIFDASKSADTGPFASLRLEGSSSSTSTSQLFHQGVFDVVDGLVVASFVQSPSTIAPDPLPQPPKIAWDSPVHEPPPVQLECLRRAERIMFRAARQLHDSEMRVSTDFITRWGEEAAEDLACALREKTTEPAADAALTYAVIASNNALNAIEETKAAHALVRTWCERRPDGAYCRLSARYEDRPLVALPRVNLASSCLGTTRPGPTAIAVTIAGGQVSVNGAAVPFEVDDPAGLQRHLPGDHDNLPVDVFADAEEPASLVLSVLDALTAAQVDEIWLGSMDRNAGYAGLPHDGAARQKAKPSRGMTWQAYLDAAARHCGAAR
jgi:hypothetical protein